MVGNVQGSNMRGSNVVNQLNAIPALVVASSNAAGTETSDKKARRKSVRVVPVRQLAEGALVILELDGAIVTFTVGSGVGPLVVGAGVGPRVVGIGDGLGVGPGVGILRLMSWRNRSLSSPS